MQDVVAHSDSPLSSYLVCSATSLFPNHDINLEGNLSGPDKIIDWISGRARYSNINLYVN